jgi:alpha-tubulin suppressor-like RCC1 family protein
MKTILSSRRHHYVARVSIFLIAIALIVGTAGCTVDGGVVEYDLTIASTGPGSVTNPGEETFTYDEGTVVDLVATTDDGQFVNWTGDVGNIANVNNATTTITMNGDYSITANFQYIPMVDAGGYHTVGLTSDGTVVAVGANHYMQCDVGNWTDITQVAAGGYHTVGLKSDGTVVAVGDDSEGQLNVGNWTDIIQVAAGNGHTVGLKSDGTVDAVGWDADNQCDVSGWTDIVKVAAGGYHTVGVKSDGTVVAVGYNEYGQCNVGGWMMKDRKSVV